MHTHMLDPGPGGPPRLLPSPQHTQCRSQEHGGSRWPGQWGCLLRPHGMASDILRAAPLFRPGTFAEPGGVEEDGGRGEGDGPKGDHDRASHSSTRSRKRGWSLEYVDLELKKRVILFVHSGLGLIYTPATSPLILKEDFNLGGGRPWAGRSGRGQQPSQCGRGQGGGRSGAAGYVGSTSSVT